MDQTGLFGTGETYMSDPNKVAIVTGAGRRWGMGYQIALGLANKGLDIAVADIREDWGKESAGAIKAETGRRAIFVKTDISKRASVQAMMRADRRAGQRRRHRAARERR